MAGQYRAQSVLLGGVTQSVGASATNTAVSRVFNISPAGATRAIRIDIKTASLTDTTGLTAKLQHSVDDTAANFADAHASAAQVTIDAEGWLSITLNASDSTDSPVFPLRPHGRIVVSTGASDAVDIEDIRVTMEE
jgi:hypothetical protein